MSGEFESAEKVHDEAGRQYHIGLAPGEVAQRILTCGDPARARRIAARFDRIDLERANREYLTFTGEYRGRALSVMATGMGPDNTEIAVIELCQVVAEPIFLRVGTCGGLQPNMEIEDLVISTGSLRLENTSTFFVHEGFPAVAHYEVVATLVEAARRLGRRHHVGITATAPGFYGAQGRKGLGFEPRFPDLPDQLARMGVKNMEMETSALFTLAAMRDLKAGAICVIFANRPRNVFIAGDRKTAAEDAAIDVALEAIVEL
ncbi:MAG: nucleoside phosphorylase [Planctomycetes bacterium]|nr:nucleoside phosphorylase [Planctomycetota bacterium]